VSIEQLPVRIAPARQVALTLRVEGESESAFEGSLAVDVTGYLTDRTIAFQTIVRFQAVPGPGEGE
jgi:hypothetical protein